MTYSVIAHQKYIRQSPRKLRLVADTVRDLSVEEALNQLEITPKRAARTLKKVLTQAKANATSGKNLDEDSLTIKALEIQEAPRLKRWRPVSRGRAHPIIKRMSHIKIQVSGTKSETTQPSKSSSQKVATAKTNNTKSKKE